MVRRRKIYFTSKSGKQLLYALTKDEKKKLAKNNNKYMALSHVSLSTQITTLLVSAQRYIPGISQGGSKQ